MHIGTKKYSLLAASVLLVVAAACGSDNKASDATTAAPAATTAGTAAPAATTAGTDAPATSAATAGTAGAATGAAPAGMKVVYVPGLTGNPFYNTVACGAQALEERLLGELRTGRRPAEVWDPEPQPDSAHEPPWPSGLP